MIADITGPDKQKENFMVTHVTKMCIMTEDDMHMCAYYKQKCLPSHLSHIFAYFSMYLWKYMMEVIPFTMELQKPVIY